MEWSDIWRIHFPETDQEKDDMGTPVGLPPGVICNQPIYILIIILEVYTW